jgi:Toprim domain
VSRPIDIKMVIDKLTDRIEELARKLLPKGIREGHEYCIGSLEGEPGRSLKICLAGAKAGIWCDFASGETGDAFDLVAQVLYRGDKKLAMAWARHWLNIDAGGAPAPTPAVRRQTHAGGGKKDDSGKAFALWLAAQERIQGTPVDRYLKGRGIDLAQLGRQPRALRFHPRLWSTESESHWPAMVANISDAGGKFMAVHRTYLQILADGRVVKAPLRDPKMTWPGFKGGSIRLWRGASGKSLKDAPEGDEAVLIEGIENGLSVALACPEKRVLATVSLANMANIDLPPAIRTVILFCDNDPPFNDGGGSSAQARGLARVIARYQHQGRMVRLARAPQGKDANDFIQGAA